MKELSLQLYSAKDAFEDTSKAEENFEKIAEMGYTGVEFAGFYGLPKEEMKKILDRTGLKAVSAHAGEDLYQTIEKYNDRMPTIHLKEITADKKDIYAGGGIIDFEKVIDMTNKPNMQYIYEFEGENAMENCEKAAAYLLSL